MKERIIIMKEVLRNKLLCLLLPCISNTYSQPSDREKLIDSLLDNTSIDFQLKEKQNGYVLLEIKNTTLDTLFVWTYLPIDQDNGPFYIMGYEKKYKDDREKDTIYYQRGALSTHSTFEPQQRMYLFEKREGKKPWYLLPKEKVLTGLGIFHKGEYYVKVQTMYFRRDKKCMVRKETNHIVIE